MLKNTKYILLFTASLLLMPSNQSLADTGGYFSGIDINLRPVDIGPQSKRDTKVICYSWYDLSHIKCEFEMMMPVPVDNTNNANFNGGHFHSPNKRPVFKPKTKLEFKGDEVPDIKDIVSGTTYPEGEGPNTVTQEMPETSGILKRYTTIIPPTGFGCFGQQYSHAHYTETFNVKIPDLKELPDVFPTGNYEKCRSHPKTGGCGGDDEHPNNVAFYGKETTLIIIDRIATRYKELSGRTLSVNDMSLIHGGLFDRNNNWTRSRLGHSTHEEGKDVDINRGGINCIDDYALQVAVDNFLPAKIRRYSERYPYSRIPSSLLCEGNPDKPDVIDSKHIDFDFIEIDALSL